MKINKLNSKLLNLIIINVLKNHDSWIFDYRTCYAANCRPDALMKEQLVEMTGLSPRVIRVWFQNKRCKDKKRAILMKQMQHEKVGIMVRVSFPLFLLLCNWGFTNGIALSLGWDRRTINFLMDVEKICRGCVYDWLNLGIWTVWTIYYLLILWTEQN